MWSQLKSAILREHQSGFVDDRLVMYSPSTKPDSISERKITKLRTFLEKHGHRTQSVKDIKQIISLLQELLPYFKKQEQDRYKKVYAKMKDEEQTKRRQKEKRV
jgi:ribosomal protein S15P/S13E